MKVFAELGLVLGLVGVCAAGTWLVRGEPARSVVCDTSVIKADEICLSQLKSKGGIVWIDARSRAMWEKDGYQGSVLWNLDPAEDAGLMEAEVAMKLVDASIAVVYCDDEACGTSRQIAERVSALQLAPEVKVLFGGWRSLAEAGLVTDSN